MKRALGPALAAVILAAAPAAAQQTFALPEGCDAYVTVQLRSCTVQHHFVCSGDPAGHQRRVDLEQDGLVYAGVVDAETQWIESAHLLAGHTERLAPGPADPARLSELMEVGEDSYDFRTLSSEVGETRYVGRDRLTGGIETIDGVPLHRTAFEIVAYSEGGAELWRAEGNEFVSTEWRIFLGGTGTVTTPGESRDYDDTPVEFIFPGEPGFLSANPKHGCGMMMSRLEVSR